MTKINMEKLQSEINTFVSERDWDQFHSVKNLAMALSVESSELVEIFQWMKESESNLIKENDSISPKVRDELADIFFYLIRLADKTGTDLEKALLAKLEKNRAKYPVEKARGNSKKYTEF